MPPSPDYRRRRAAVIAVAAMMLVSAGHRTPMIGTLSISIDDKAAQIDADWAPPVALAIAGVAHVTAAIGTLLPR